MSLFDENAAILRNIEASGTELGPSRSVDFSYVFTHQASADAFAREAEQEGFSTFIEEVESDVDPWDVTASKDMAPTCENITATEKRLNAIAQPHQGRADGWGFFGD
jgi:hypothetical protein